jgi:hypothetical protein
LRQPLHRGRVLEPEQGPGVPGGQHAGRHPPLHQRRQLEQPDGVGDLRPGAADPGGELVVGAAEVVQQLLVGRTLLERVELAAVQVLQQRVAQQVVVGGVPHDRRDRAEAGLLGGPPAPLAHDELVAGLAVAGQRPDHDRLQDADLADGVHQLGQRLLLEVLARLPRVRPDRPDRELREAGTRDREQLRFVRRAGGRGRVHGRRHAVRDRGSGRRLDLRSPVVSRETLVARRGRLVLLREEDVDRTVTRRARGRRRDQRAEASAQAASLVTHLRSSTLCWPPFAPGGPFSAISRAASR